MRFRVQAQLFQVDSWGFLQPRLGIVNSMNISGWVKTKENGGAGISLFAHSSRLPGIPRVVAQLGAGSKTASERNNGAPNSVIAGMRQSTSGAVGSDIFSQWIDPLSHHLMLEGIIEGDYFPRHPCAHRLRSNLRWCGTCSGSREVKVLKSISERNLRRIPWVHSVKYMLCILVIHKILQYT